MTTDINIEIDVRARWINGIPAYRIWVDDELICERSFWPNPEKFLIRENFVVKVEQGKHELKLEQIDTQSGMVIMHKVDIVNLENKTASAHRLSQQESGKFQTLTFNA